MDLPVAEGAEQTEGNLQLQEREENVFMAKKNIQGSPVGTPTRTIPAERTQEQAVEESRRSSYATLGQLAGGIQRNSGRHGHQQTKRRETHRLEGDLKQHLAALPEGLKSQLEGIIHPKVETTEKSAAAKMKASIGTLRDLSNRRDGAQAKVDQSKDQYKTALQDLQDLQKQIDLTQEELKQTTAEYARIAMEKKIEEIPMDTKVEEETMWQLMEQVGITVDEDKKEQLQKLLEENQTKRRKTGPERGQKCG